MLKSYNHNEMKILTVIGARPQFVKAAMVSRAIIDHKKQGRRPFITEEIIHTGQHHDTGMSQVFFEQLEIPKPAANLNINNASHGVMTGRMLEALENEMVSRHPDWVLIYGDTNSTLAGALAASKLNIPVAHVEAGLRSFNRLMPEEINRIISDQISSLLLCPTKTAVENLKAEGFSRIVGKGNQWLNDTEWLSQEPSDWDSAHQIGIVANVGDVMYDAALIFGKLAEDKSHILDALKLTSGKYYLATVHRAENTDTPGNLNEIMEGLNRISKKFPVVLPVHPRITKKIESWKNGLSDNQLKRWRFIGPVSFLDMVQLEKSASVILTDSGGVQKEACFHSVPCVTLRNETEWAETIAKGWNRLAGPNADRIVHLAEQAKPGEFINEFGNGKSAKAILSALIKFS